jgi:hypothetical protein
MGGRSNPESARNGQVSVRNKRKRRNRGERPPSLPSANLAASNKRGTVLAKKDCFENGGKSFNPALAEHP